MLVFQFLTYRNPSRMIPLADKQSDADGDAKDMAKDTGPRIKFLPDPRSNDDAVLRIPSPRARDNGQLSWSLSVPFACNLIAETPGIVRVSKGAD